MHSGRRTVWVGATAALVVALTGAGAQAQAPVLVKDILGGTLPSWPQLTVTVGTTTFFRANDGISGAELWKTDGTAAGTMRVKDIDPGPGGAEIGLLTRVGTTLFFTANTASAGIELWKSDGTTAGTVMVKDIRAGASGSNPDFLVALGSTLYFVASDGPHGTELWRSDGTAGGTVMVKDIVAGADSSLPRELTIFKGRVYFSAVAGGRVGLWASDGTAEGTVLVKAPNPGPGASGVVQPTPAGDFLFFGGNGGSTGLELWRSDGTPGGTVLVADVKAGSTGSDVDHLTAFNGLLFFSADGGSGRELWKSDGTAAGTLMVRDIDPRGHSGPQLLTPVGTQLFFSASHPESGLELWRTDGTNAGTVLVADIAPGVNGSQPGNLTEVGGTLYFTADDGRDGVELWKSDGTAAGTVELKDIYPGRVSSYPTALVEAGGTLLFSADDGMFARELWKSDGTSAGTVLLEDINAVPATSTPAELVNVNGRLYFQAADEHGAELWTSDGTAAGTRLVSDLWPGLTGSRPGNLTSVAGKLYFTATDPAAGLELRTSDGSAAGTVLVKEITAGALGSSLAQLADIGGTLFFQGAATGGSTLQAKLWKSTGTSAGTVVVKDINPGGSADVGSIINAAGVAYFRANDGASGLELWKSDGTAAGTVLVKNIGPGSASGYPQHLTAVGSTVYFTANDGSHGLELWKSDGTAAGTVMVKDINPGSGSASPSGLVASRGWLFFSANNGSSGAELWRTDGTAAGTILVKDIYGGAIGANPSSLTDVNGTVFFSAGESATGWELWKSDGTAAGTVMVKDIRPGSGSSSVSSLVNVNGLAYFAANDGSSGVELWRSDGTAAGTVLVADLMPGIDSSQPDNFVAVGGTLYFVAFSPSSGRELWKVAGAVPAPRITAWPPTLTIGGTTTISGTNFTPGAVVKLYVATGSGPMSHGPFPIASYSPTSISFVAPATVPLGNGFAAVQVVNTDADYRESNIVGTLLYGAASRNMPTITRIDGTDLAPADLAIGLAHADVVVAKGTTVTLTGTGFNNAKVNIYTAGGNLGPLTPLAGATASQIQVSIPAGATTGPANFQVVNSPYTGNVISNAVAAVLGARPTITAVTVAGGTVTVTGTGFSVVSVINLFNVQGGGVVNIGGIGPSGPRVPLTVVSDREFRFAIPAAAVPGRAFVQVLNPPFIAFASSGADPDGAFSFPAAAAPDTSTAADEDLLGPDMEVTSADGTPGARSERVRWTRAVAARVRGAALEHDAGAAWRAGARSTRAILRGDGGVSWRVDGRAGEVLVGLSHGDHDASAADVDFGLRTRPDSGELDVMENGVSRATVGTFTDGDRLRVAVHDGVVEYWRNDTLLWISDTKPRYPLLVDVSFGARASRLAAARVRGALGSVVDWLETDGIVTSSTEAAADRDAVVTADGATTWPAAVEGGLEGEATIGFSLDASKAGTCDLCITTRGGEVHVQHLGMVRGTWKAEPGFRYRIEASAHGEVRYFAGDTQIDAAPVVDTALLPVVRAAMGAGGGKVVFPTVEPGR